MTRRYVITATMFKYRRSAPKTPFLGWGYVATRKARTVAASPRLLAYRSCMAANIKKAKLEGKITNLEQVQKIFKETAPACAREASTKKTIKKKARTEV